MPIQDSPKMQELRHLLKHRVKRLAKALDNDMPDCVLALELSGIRRMAYILFPDLISSEEARQLTTAARQACGLCQYCDNPVAPSVTHPPICERCDAKMEDECKALEAEYEDEDEDD